MASVPAGFAFSWVLWEHVRLPDLLATVVALMGLHAALAVGTAKAATVTVCRAGCDYNSIREAIEGVDPGDTIRVSSGSYGEILHIDKDVAVEGEGPLTTTIDGGDQATVITIDANATVAISGVTIAGGAGSAGGSTNDAGGIHNRGVLTLSDCVVEENAAPKDPSGTGKGGGVRNDGDLTMNRCTVSENVSAGRGGGVYNTGTLSLHECTVCANTASGGGGIFNEGELTITSSAVVDNRVDEDGGAILNEGSCTLTNVTVSGNRALRNGGGVAVRAGGAPVAPTTLVHTTVADNEASNRQGGSGIYNESSTPVTLESSIIAGNQGSRNCSGETLSRGFNIDGDDSCGLDAAGERPDQPGTDPFLGQLGYQGGNTLTHALRAGSPAIDSAGDNSSCTVGVDQRGLPRPAGGLCDVGAYERPSCEPQLAAIEFTRGDANGDANINLTDALVILQGLFEEGRTHPCSDAADTDDDGALRITDAIYLLNWLFLNGSRLPGPERCGPDPTSDPLGCAVAGACAGGVSTFRDLWTSAEELAGKPTSGEAWDAVWSAAEDACPGEANLANQDSNANVQILAAAIAYARLREEEPESAQRMRSKVIDALERLVNDGNPREAIGCPAGCGKAVNETLAWGREAGAYVLAADLVRYRTPRFESWLRELAEVYVACDGRTMLDAFEQRPNNWGLMNFGSLVALYAYLGDTDRLEYVRSYFERGLAGELPDCADVGPEIPCFIWGGGRDPEEKDMTWHSDRSRPALIAPAAVIRIGDSEIELDGLIPDDQRRGCSLCPPENADAFCESVPEEDRCVRPRPDSHITDWMTAAVMGARILERVGMPIWASADQALKRMLYAHMVTHCQLTCDDDGFQCEALYNCKDWIVPVLDEAYDLSVEFDPPPTTDCECPFELEGRGTGASKNAGFGAYIVP